MGGAAARCHCPRAARVLRLSRPQVEPSSGVVVGNNLRVLHGLGVGYKSQHSGGSDHSCCYGFPSRARLCACSGARTSSPRRVHADPLSMRAQLTVAAHSCLRPNSGTLPQRCGLTLRSSGPPPARHLGREAASVIIRLAAQAPSRRVPLS
jgi:hypothetical protein